MDCSTPGSPVFHYLLKFAQTHVHRVSDATQPFHPLSSPSLPVLNLSQHQGKWPKYWSFSFSISPFNEYPGLVSFRIDCFDLLAVQGTLKRVFSNNTVEKHQFFGAQPSLWSKCHICTWLLEKPHLWLHGTFISKAMSLLFHTLSRFVIAWFCWGAWTQPGFCIEWLSLSSSCSELHPWWQCHQGHVHPLDQRQEADDPICPTGPVMLCQPHTFSAGDRLAWKGRAQRLSVATITPSDAGRRKTCGGVAHCPPSSKCLLSLKEVWINFSRHYGSADL